MLYRNFSLSHKAFSKRKLSKKTLLALETGLQKSLLCLLVLWLCACQSVPDQSAEGEEPVLEGFSTVADSDESSDEASGYGDVPGDPWEQSNRRVHAFNEFADKVLARPVAKVYDKTPGFFKKRVSNFFQNLSNVNNMVNNLFQGKIGRAASDFGRLLTNSTIGLGGLFDPAQRMGMVQSEEDWGQTFAKWGMGSGPYVVMPFLGPNTVRSTFGRVLDTVFDPLRLFNPERDTYGMMLMRATNDRAGLLSVEGMIFGDKYIFYRDGYLQRRDYLINDGVVEDPFGDEF